MGLKNTKFPKPNEINFPAVNQKKWKVSFPYKIEYSNEIEIKKIAMNLCLLKSGNILITYIERDEIDFTVRSYLSIFNVPDLKEVENYEYQYEVNKNIYMLTYSNQSKDGNIFSIGDKIYIFDGESISKGPSKNSEKINDINFHNQLFQFFESSDKEQRNPIKKNGKIFLGNFFLEVKECIYLYTDASFSYNREIFLVDISNSKIERKKIFSYDKETKYGSSYYQFNILTLSEYYPENLYICAYLNLKEEKYESVLLCFNLEEFINTTKSSKEPLFSIPVNNSEIIIGFCEYDKKYLLLECYKNGIYIIDIELKQIVSVSVPKCFLSDINKYYNIYKDRKRNEGFIYSKIIKLKDGQVFINGDIINIREQKSIKIMREYKFRSFVVSGDYIIYFFKDSSIYVFQIKDEE